MQLSTLRMDDRWVFQLKFTGKPLKYILSLPLVTPLVALHPCHSFTSLLWQHRPSDPIAEDDKKALVSEITSPIALKKKSLGIF